jgi:hypothetical protein
VARYILAEFDRGLTTVEEFEAFITRASPRWMAAAETLDLARRVLYQWP